MNAPLDGIRVIDLSRLAPGPYGTMLLADLGADVIVVGGGRAGTAVPQLARGKTHITLDLKTPVGLSALRRLVSTADVVIEGFRPGVADRIGAGFGALREVKEDLVYCSVTGWGQSGPLAQTAGHDINYLAITGALGAFGPMDGPPVAPLNLLADFGGGGFLAAFGIMAALRSRDATGEAQYVDAAMVDGVMSLMTMHYPSWGTPTLPSRGLGLLGGEAPFYRCYACSDGRFVAVGAFERVFFKALWDGLRFDGPVPDHFDQAGWPAMTQQLTAAFAQRSRDEWGRHFDGSDACVTPVLDPAEAWENPHVQSRILRAGSTPAIPQIAPSGAVDRDTDLTDRTAQVLADAGVTAEDIELIIATPATARTGLAWPPA